MTDQADPCSSCQETCPSKEHNFQVPQGPLNDVKHVIAVMSGKGGVGKSSITGLLAASFAREGYKVGILDADITGPSIPKIFGLRERANSAEYGLLPVKSKKLGIPIMSINLLLEREEDPVIWRGPIIAGVVKQFWQDVVWGELDYLFVDLPPGTGDAPLTVMQSLPLDGIVVVSSPQDLAVMVVKKAVNMAELLEIPILGLVENMSYAVCPHCHERFELFGSSQGQAVADSVHIPLLASLPLDPALAALCDEGRIEEYAPQGTNVVKSITARVK